MSMCGLNGHASAVALHGTKGLQAFHPYFCRYDEAGGDRTEDRDTQMFCPDASELAQVPGSREQAAILRVP